MPIIEQVSTDEVTEDSDDNLLQFPTIKINLNQPIDKQLAIGDLHGNALKLLHFLLKENIVFWPEALAPTQRYQEFCSLYRDTDWQQNNAGQKEKLRRINELINTLKVNLPCPDLIFLGDELGDRGKHDLITFWLFSFLSKNKVPYVSCYSNHTHAFTLIYEQVIIQNQPFQKYADPYHSLNALFYALEQHWIERDEVIQLVSSHQQHLCLISYGLDAQGVMQYTHAPTSHNIGQHVANSLNLFYLDDTPEHLAWSIEQINSAFFSWFIQTNKIHTLPFKDAIDKLIAKQEVKEESAPIECLMWNRAYSALQRYEKHPEYDYPICSTHGHDDQDPQKNQKTIIVLDSNFGKAESPFYISGKHSPNPILHTNRTRLSYQRSKELATEITLAIQGELFQHSQNFALFNTEATKEALEKTEKRYSPLLNQQIFAKVHPQIRQCTMQLIEYKDKILFSKEYGVNDLFKLHSEIEELQAKIDHTQSALLKQQLTPYLERWAEQFIQLENQYEQIDGPKGLTNKLSEAEQLINTNATSGVGDALKRDIASIREFIEKDTTPLVIKLQVTNKTCKDLLEKAFHEEYQHIRQLCNQELESPASLQQNIDLLDLIAKILNQFLDEPIQSIKTVSDLFSQEIHSLSATLSQPITYSTLQKIKRRMLLLEKIGDHDLISHLKDLETEQNNYFEGNGERLNKTLHQYCHTYFQYLNQKYHKPGKEDEKEYWIGLLITFLTQAGFSPATTLSTFCNAFKTCSDTLKSRRTLFWVSIKKDGDTNKALSSLSQTTGISKSKGHDFVNQVEELFQQEDEYFARLQ